MIPSLNEVSFRIAGNSPKKKLRLETFFGKVHSIPFKYYGEP